jgi:hypothetical protein
VQEERVSLLFAQGMEAKGLGFDEARRIPRLYIYAP